MIHLRSHGVTDIGRRRSTNEDAFLCDEELGLFIVADGLGGHDAGEVASSEAVDVIHAWVRRNRSAVTALAEEPWNKDVHARARRMMEGAIMAATYHLHGLAELQGHTLGMGTTSSVLVIAGASAVLGQVGDSRIYRLRNGKIEQLTQDHSLVAMQVAAGILTPEEAEKAQHRNFVTRAVGSQEYVEVDTTIIDVQDGDAFLLCSDGLHGYVKLDELPGYLFGPVEDCAMRLIDLANSRGGKDNITAVVIRVGE